MVPPCSGKEQGLFWHSGGNTEALSLLAMLSAAAGAPRRSRQEPLGQQREHREAAVRVGGGAPGCSSIPQPLEGSPGWAGLFAEGLLNKSIDTGRRL